MAGKYEFGTFVDCRGNPSLLGAMKRHCFVDIIGGTPPSSKLIKNPSIFNFHNIIRIASFWVLEGLGPLGI